VFSYFWYEQEEAYAIATAAVAALNHAAGWDCFMDFDALQFFADYPGPFAKHRDRCPGRGRFTGIICQYSQTALLQCFHLSDARRAKLIARQLTRSLNELCEQSRNLAFFAHGLAIGHGIRAEPSASFLP
jgi:hypothetical protein